MTIIDTFTTMYKQKRLFWTKKSVFINTEKLKHVFILAQKTITKNKILKQHALPIRRLKTSYIKIIDKKLCYFNKATNFAVRRKK